MNANIRFGFRKFGVLALFSVGLLSWGVSAFAAGWVELSSPTTSLLLGMDCASSSTCIAVGVGGTIVRTSNDKTWATVSSGVTTNLWEVDFSGSTGFAVGDSGVILKSTDSGATWTNITGVTTESLLGVSVVSSSVAYVAGQDGATLKTTDGGTTWTSLASGLSAFDAYAIDAYSATVAYVVGKAGGAYKTTDGGTTWTALTTGTTSALYTVEAVSATTVFMAGENRTLVKTTDGSTFSAQSLSSFSTTESVFDIACSTSTLCLTAGSSGTVMSSGNGGSTWTAETIPGGHGLGALANVAVGRRFVVGENGAIIALDIYSPSAVGGLALSAGGTSTTDTTPEFTWTDATDNESSVASYAIDVDSSGTYTNMGDVNSYSLTAALSTGSHTVTVIAVDAAGNNGTASSITFTVSGTSADTTSPTVGSVTPTSVTANVVTELSVTYSDDVAVTSCTLFDGGSPYAMTLSDGKATYSATFESTGSHSMYVLCGDAAGNVGTGATTTVTVVSSGADTTAPVVSAITPTTAIVGTTTAFSASVTEAVGISSCYLYVDGANKGAMTMTTGKASYSFAPSAAGTLSVYALCTDTSGNIGTGTATSIIVSSASTDTTAPTVGSVSPLTAIAGVSTTFSTTYSDAVGVTSCVAYVNGSAKSMALASGTASIITSVSAAGSYSVYVTCTDAAGNIGTGSTATVVVSAASTDTTAPTVSAITPTTATQNTAVTFSVTATDATGIYGCYLMVDGNAQGSMTASSSTYSRSYTPASSGTLTAYAWCGDTVGNVGTGASTTVTVAAAAVTATDTTAPTVGAMTPSTAVAGEPTTLSASVADSGGMGSCVLYVNSTRIGTMTISGGYATYLYTFSAEGSAISNAYCVDAAGNATRGSSTTIVVSASTTTSSEEDVAVSEAESGSLIKLACGSDADVEDPCHAVYYYDGKRHAFPNEKVFLTWYANFDNVIVVTQDFLSSITLGFNVTYHPGTRMVKFVSQNTVYAVGEAGELRAVASEDVATSIWGSDWNTQIDDISDAFYGNYHFGDDINSTSDFDPDAVESSVTDIVDILQV